MIEKNLIDTKVTSGKHVSYWIDSIDHPISYSPLTENLETEATTFSIGRMYALEMHREME